MTIAKKTVADKVADYLHHRISLDQLVEWSENAILDATFHEPDAAVLSQVISRLGVADVRSFGLAWEDCEDLLAKLGYTPRVTVVAAA